MIILNNTDEDTYQDDQDDQNDQWKHDMINHLPFACRFISPYISFCYLVKRPTWRMFLAMSLKQRYLGISWHRQTQPMVPGFHRCSSGHCWRMLKFKITNHVCLSCCWLPGAESPTSMEDPLLFKSATNIWAPPSLFPTRNDPRNDPKWPEKVPTRSTRSSQATMSCCSLMIAPWWCSWSWRSPVSPSNDQNHQVLSQGYIKNHQNNSRLEISMRDGVELS